MRIVREPEKDALAPKRQARAEVALVRMEKPRVWARLRHGERQRVSRFIINWLKPTVLITCSVPTNERDSKTFRRGSHTASSSGLHRPWTYEVLFDRDLDTKGE